MVGTANVFRKHYFLCYHCKQIKVLGLYDCQGIMQPNDLTFVFVNDIANTVGERLISAGHRTC